MHLVYRWRTFADGMCISLLGAMMFHASSACAATCTVAAAPVEFGNYNGVTRSVVNATVGITVSCVDLLFVLVSYRISVSAGQSGDPSFRYMSSGPNRLRYQMFVDPARTTIAGDGTAGTSTIPGNARTLSGLFSASKTETIYASILADQPAVPGYYSDAVTLQITY